MHPVTGMTLIFEDLSKIFESLYTDIVKAIPHIIEALIILIIGYIIGRLIGESIRLFLQKILGLDKWLEMRRLEDAAFGIRISSLIAGLIKWYIYFIFITEAVSRLNIEAINMYLQLFTLYYPRILAATALFIFGLILSEWLKERVEETMLVFREFIGGIVKFITATIFFLLALDMLTVNVQPIYQLIYYAMGGFIVAISIGFGIALGFILKDELRPYVRHFLEEVTKKHEEKET